MGTRKWREKNMVNPSWDSFQRPTKKSEGSQEKEFIEEIPGKIKDEEKPEGDKPQWGNFKTPTTYQGEPDPTEDESGLEYLVRNATTLASRVGEQIGGRYGNVEKFAKDALVSFPKTGGLVGWAISELVGPETWERMVRGRPGEQQTFPTSENLKEASQKLTGGYTKPKTKNEERIGEFIEDVGSTLGGKRAISAVNNLLIPAAANATKQIVKENGFGEDKANLAKLAVWLPLSLAGNVNAARYASDLMNQGRQGLPNTLQANVPRFTQRLDKVANSHLLLHSDPRSALARQVLAGIRNDLSNGQNNIQSLMTSYDGVNAAKRNRGLFELGKSDQKFAKRAIDEVKNAVKDEIMDVGAQYPDALNKWKNGLNAWATIHQSNALTNWIEGLAKGPYAKMLGGPAAGLFGGGLYGTVKSPIISGSAAVAVPATYKTGQVLYRMWNDKNLNNYYWKAISEAQKENAPAFINNYNKLNKELKKKEPSFKKSKK